MLIKLLNLVSGVVFAALIISCSPDDSKKDNKASAETETASSETGTDDEADSGSDEPADVNSLFLSMSCQSLGGHQDKGRYSLQCRIVDKEGQAIAPAAFSDSYDWKVVGGELGANVSIAESSDSDGYFVKIVVGDTAFVAAEIVTALEVKLTFVDKKSKEAGSLSQRMNTIYAGLANQKYFRMVILSIRDHDPAAPIHFLTSIAFKVNGAWHDLTLNEATLALSLGVSPVTTNGNAVDAGIFMNVFGKNDPVLTASQIPRFAGNGLSYDAGEPLHLIFGSGKPSSVTGFRYDGGKPIANRNVAAGFPDSILFETSADQITWTPVKGSKIDIESVNDQDIFEYIWSGFDL